MQCALFSFNLKRTYTHARTHPTTHPLPQVQKARAQKQLTEAKDTIGKVCVEECVCVSDRESLSHI